MCGVAGSGKTTYAKRLVELEGFERLSIDEEIWRQFGRFGFDYAAKDYEQLSTLVEAELEARLVDLIGQGRWVVVDFSFWQRAQRDYYKRLIEQAGGTWRLVYLKVDLEELRRRLTRRNARPEPNAAFPITDEVLTGYLNSFEEPEGEGEEIVS